MSQQGIEYVTSLGASLQDEVQFATPQLLGTIEDSPYSIHEARGPHGLPGGDQLGRQLLAVCDAVEQPLVNVYHAATLKPNMIAEKMARCYKDRILNALLPPGFKTGNLWGLSIELVAPDELPPIVTNNPAIIASDKDQQSTTQRKLTNYNLFHRLSGEVTRGPKTSSVACVLTAMPVLMSRGKENAIDWRLLAVPFSSSRTVPEEESAYSRRRAETLLGISFGRPSPSGRRALESFTRR